MGLTRPPRCRVQVALAQIQTAAAQRVAGLKGAANLSLHGFCNGRSQPCDSHDLPEDGKPKAIQTFLSQFRSGTRCRKGAPPLTSPHLPLIFPPS